jgi:hypothetical protein
MTLRDATSCVVDDRRESTVTTLNGLQLLNTNREYSSWYTRAAAVLHKTEEEIEVTTFETRIVTSDAYRIWNGTGRILNYSQQKFIFHLNLTFTRRIKWVGYEACMDEKRLHAKFGRVKWRKEALEKPRCTWDGNIKVDLKSRLGVHGLHSSASR